MNVLVIEDNEQNLYLVRFLLEARGHRVAEARDGPEGIAAARAATPDIILLDIQLPQMDGYAVARTLRAMPALDAVPIVAVTSYAMNGDWVKALASGCDAYIEKPIDPDTFAAEVAAAAGRRKKERAS
jgi:CheY-like chemotaxis protein